MILKIKTMEEKNLGKRTMRPNHLTFAVLIAIITSSFAVFVKSHEKKIMQMVNFALMRIIKNPVMEIIPKSYVVNVVNQLGIVI